MTFAAAVPSAALSEHLLTAGFWQSLKAPWVQRLWSTWQNVHNCVCLQGTTPENMPTEADSEWNKLSSKGFAHSFSQAQGVTMTWRGKQLLHKTSELSSSNDLKRAQAERWTILQRCRVRILHLRCCLTMSLLSMPTFRRLAATEPMSFSESQDLKSFTAKHAETPE